jgi:hypothetical protein
VQAYLEAAHAGKPGEPTLGEMQRGTPGFQVHHFDTSQQQLYAQNARRELEENRK